MGLFREDVHREPEYRADNEHWTRGRAGKLHVARILSEVSRASGTYDHQLDGQVARGGVDVHSQSVPGRTSEGE